MKLNRELPDLLVWSEILVLEVFPAYLVAKEKKVNLLKLPIPAVKDKRENLDLTESEDQPASQDPLDYQAKKDPKEKLAYLYDATLKVDMYSLQTTFHPTLIRAYLDRPA